MTADLTSRITREQVPIADAPARRAYPVLRPFAVESVDEDVYWVCAPNASLAKAYVRDRRIMKGLGGALPKIIPIPMRPETL